MYLSILTYAIEFLQGEVSEAGDMQELAYFEGVFKAFAAHEKKGALDHLLFADFLSDFIREGGFERTILDEKLPQLLEDLEKMLAVSITN